MGKVLIIDVTRCNGCYNCQIACKDEHVGNDWTPYAKPQPDTGQFWMKVCKQKNLVVMFAKCLRKMGKASVGGTGLEPVTP